MRFTITSILLSLLVISCALKPKINTNNVAKNDTLKFEHIYVEALKNKMLSRNELAKKQFKECLKLKSQSTAAAYQLAVLLYDEHKYDEAKKYAEFCLKYKPDSQWYLLLRASIARELNNTKVYGDIYKKLVAANPNNLEYNYELALICYNNNDLNRALSILNEIQMQLGVNETVSYLKNSIYYKQKKYNFIEIELKTLLKTYPDSTKYSDMLADFYVKFNQTDKAILLFNDAFKKDSSDVNTKIALAWLYANQQQYSEGLPYLTNILPNPNIGFERKYKVASFYLYAQNNTLPDSSVNKIYSLLYKNNDITGEFLAKYIAYLYAKKDLTRAEKYSLIAIDKFPDNFDSWNLYFDILLRLNRYDALNKYATKCLEYFPNQASVYFYCGYSHFLLKHYDKAIGYLQTSIDYSIDNEELTKQNYLIIAESYHRIGKHKDSDKYFDKYLQKDSSNAYLLNNYAYYLLQRGTKYEKAIKLSRKSLEIEPFNSSFLDTYAWILFTQQQYDMALNYIQRAYKYGGNKNATILDHYGDIYNKLGNKENANIMWKEAYRISKSKKILEKIDK